MRHSLILRPELSGDCHAIDHLIRASFKQSILGYSAEAELVNTLRENGELSLSIVAESDDEIERQIIGQIAFSPITMTGNTREKWFCLAPLSVLPSAQKQKVGTHLIQSGIAGLKKRGANGIIVLGDERYYQPFGFKHALSCTLMGKISTDLLAYSFDGSILTGDIQLSHGFKLCV